MRRNLRGSKADYTNEKKKKRKYNQLNKQINTSNK